MEGFGPAVPADQSLIRSLLALKNGEVVSGGQNGSLRRWRDGKSLGAPIPTDQGKVFSLAELGNGEVVSGGENGTGTLKSEALEASTTDTGTEFSKMIVSQQAYSAAAQVVSTVNEMYGTLADIKS